MKRLTLLVLPVLLMPQPVQAACAAASQFTFLYANQAQATLAYGSTYNYTATTPAGAARAFSVAIAQNGLSNTTVNAIQMPAIGTLITGTDTTKADLVLGGTFSARTADINSGTRVVTVTFTFAQPIRDFAMTLHDIDFTTNQYRDWLQVTGAIGGTTYNPALTTPWGTSNANGAARATANSSATLGTSATPFALTIAQAAGTAASTNNSDTGTISASFLQPVTSVTVRYGNAPYTAGENTTGQQGIGIAGLSFCPMPDVSVVKKSTPATGTFGAFALPGNDIIYSLTVNNAGASPVDPGSVILTDALPAGITFRNDAFDGTTTSPFKLVDSGSGVTLGSPAYSSDGTTFGFTPSAGYDTRVRAVRVTPAGGMAASSSFTVQFKAQIR